MAVTARLPWWVVEVNGKLLPHPERSAAVQRVYQLSREGLGQVKICLRLEEEKHTPPGKRWTPSYVAKLLSDRRVLGEYQPRKGKEKDGEPIPTYFPLIVTEKDFADAQAGAKVRTNKGNGALLKLKGIRGRTSKLAVNLFAGVVFDGRSGSPYRASTHLVDSSLGKHSKIHRVLITADSTKGRGQANSFPLETFELAVCSMLDEVNIKELLSESQGPSEVDILRGQLAIVKGELAEGRELLKVKIVKALVDRMGELEEQEDQLEKDIQLQSGGQRPSAETWKETKSLIKLVKETGPTDEQRLKLRLMLRKLIESVWVVFTSHKRDRMATVQIWFAGGGMRWVEILHRPPRANKAGRTPGRWYAQGVKWKETEGKLDLRKPEDVESVLGGMEQEPWDEGRFSFTRWTGEL